MRFEGGGEFLPGGFLFPLPPHPRSLARVYRASLRCSLPPALFFQTILTFFFILFYYLILRLLFFFSSLPLFFFSR